MPEMMRKLCNPSPFEAAFLHRRSQVMAGSTLAHPLVALSLDTSVNDFDPLSVSEKHTENDEVVSTLNETCQSTDIWFVLS
ncbi:hypothetical protein IVB22_34490 [Bradyrhizobium sp. 190]|uniref:hypothetical protein n=1 Tax=Bradyrhizobium sp. 190 TaxID=2782658 RepID=UPI001FF9CAA3|nr:hypothetical protein [Bradyrhizobium sp. 190]MCK1517526.1 hypothetical protein [Bradyrhizobium sp. 190]